jgi:hypothetical protein
MGAESIYQKKGMKKKENHVKKEYSKEYYWQWFDEKSIKW